MSLLLNKKVLIVDDEKTIRDILGRYFRRRRFEVMQACSTDEALNIFPFYQPQIVILDILMAGRNGIEALAELRKMCPVVKVVMITAAKNEEIFHKCMKLGALDYIVKPFELCRLDAQIFGKLLCSRYH